MADGAAAVPGFDVGGEALKHLIGQGMMGTLLALTILAIIWQQLRRDKDTEARIKEGRESLVSSAEINRILGTVKDAMASLTQSDAGLSTQVLMSNADTKAALGSLIAASDRQGREVEEFDKRLQAIENALRDLKSSVDRAGGQWRDGAPR